LKRTITRFCFDRNGKHFDVALILSIFLGVFGADRFYLGYYGKNTINSSFNQLNYCSIAGMGCLKAFTLGFFFIWHLIDIILIASQIVTPADGSKCKYYI
jgi:TM2 domain-containing membrane protein YozV